MNVSQGLPLIKNEQSYSSVLRIAEKVVWSIWIISAMKIVAFQEWNISLSSGLYVKHYKPFPVQFQKIYFPLGIGLSLEQYILHNLMKYILSLLHNLFWAEDYTWFWEPTIKIWTELGHKFDLI